MLFLIPNEDGRIIQANKVYDPTGYDKRLDDVGVKYVKVDHPGVLSPDVWMVSNEAPAERPIMQIVVSKTTIKAGGTDASVLTGAPKDVAFTVTVMGTTVWDGTLPDGELELTVPSPGLYHIALKKWPYQDFATEVEAVA